MQRPWIPLALALLIEVPCLTSALATFRVDVVSVVSSNRLEKLRATQALISRAEQSEEPQRSSMLFRAKQACEDLIWGGMDYVSALAIVGRAEISILEGHATEAADLLRKHMSLIRYSSREMRRNNITTVRTPDLQMTNLLRRAQLLLDQERKGEPEPEP
jgi:hypothetical protein